MIDDLKNLNDRLLSFEYELLELNKEKDLNGLKIQKISEDIQFVQEKLQYLTDSLKKSHLFDNVNVDATNLKSNIEELAEIMRRFNGRLTDLDSRFRELEHLVIDFYSNYLSNFNGGLDSALGDLIDPNLKIEFEQLRISPVSSMKTQDSSSLQINIAEKIQLGKKMLEMLEKKFQNGEITPHEYQNSCKRIRIVLQELTINTSTFTRQ